MFLNVSLTLLQAEEESGLRAQVSGLGQELAAEKSQTTALQKALEQSQQSHSKLQSDLYGKESEISALHQDLEVGRGDSDGIAAFGGGRSSTFLSRVSERTSVSVSGCAGITGEAERGSGRADCQQDPPGRSGESDQGAAERPRLAAAGAGETQPEAPAAGAKPAGASEATGEARQLCLCFFALHVLFV